MCAGLQLTAVAIVVTVSSLGNPVLLCDMFCQVLQQILACSVSSCYFKLEKFQENLNIFLYKNYNIFSWNILDHCLAEKLTVISKQRLRAKKKMHVQYLAHALTLPLPRNIHAVFQVPHSELPKAPFRKPLQHLLRSNSLLNKIYPRGIIAY